MKPLIALPEVYTALQRQSCHDNLSAPLKVMCVIISRITARNYIRGTLNLRNTFTTQNHYIIHNGGGILQILTIHKQGKASRRRQNDAFSARASSVNFPIRKTYVLKYSFAEFNELRKQKYNMAYRQEHTHSIKILVLNLFCCIFIFLYIVFMKCTVFVFSFCF